MPETRRVESDMVIYNWLDLFDADTGLHKSVRTFSDHFHHVDLYGNGLSIKDSDPTKTGMTAKN